jgi:hypothetical protein
MTEQTLTVFEVAELLQRTPTRVRQFCLAGVLASRFASPSEIAHLLEQKRIKSAPHSGIRLIELAAVTTYREAQHVVTLT